MNLWQIAWRNLGRRKLRTFLTILSIVIGVGSTMAVVSTVDTARTVFPQYLKAAFGKADYNVNGSDAALREDVWQAVAQLDGAVSIAASKKNAELALDRDGVNAIQRRVDLIGFSAFDTPLTGFKLVSGSLEANGAVITDRTAKVWKAEAGDTVSLKANGAVRDVPIAAVVRYTVELMGPSSWMMAKYHPWTVAVPLETLQAWYGTEGKIDTVLVKALDGIDASSLESRLDALVKPFGNAYVQPVILDFELQFQTVDTFFIALYIAGLLGIALSAFIIFNTLYMSVKERRGEFAALKTIGFTTGQLQNFVLFEVILLSLIGTVVGLLFGAGLGSLLKLAVFLLFSVYDDTGIDLTIGLAAAIPAGLLVPIAAAIYPIRQAGRVSVIDAIKYNSALRRPHAFGGWSLILGLLLVASAFFIQHLALIVPLLTGVVLLFPHLFRAFLAAMRPLSRRAFGFSGELAVRNLGRNPTRSAMTSVVLCAGIALIVLMSSLNGALMQTYERIIYASYGGNLDIMLHHAEKDDLTRLRQVEGVADAQIYGHDTAVWLLDDTKRKLPVFGVGASWIDRFPLFTMTDAGKTPGQLIGALQDDEVVLDRIAFNVWGGQLGGTIRLQTLLGEREFRVAAVVDTMKNSGYGAFLPDAPFRENFGENKEKNALVLKDASTSSLQLRERIFDQFGSRIMEMFGPEDWVSVISANYMGSFAIINALIILSVLISGIGIANTLLMSILERVRELGMMRAIGVTRRQVVRMVLLEGLGMGVAATVVGCAFGVLLIYITSTFLEINSLTYSFGVPWNILLIIAVFGLAVSLLASYSPASRASKTRLSEALRYE